GAGVLPAPAWVNTYKGDPMSIVHSVAVAADSQSAILFGGNFDYTVTICANQILTATLGPSTFVGKLSPSGACDWGLSFGSAHGMHRNDPTVHGEPTFVTGSYPGTPGASLAEFGLAAQTAGGAFVVANSAQGMPSWAVACGETVDFDRVYPY